MDVTIGRHGSTERFGDRPSIFEATGMSGGWTKCYCKAVDTSSCEEGAGTESESSGHS